MCVGNFVEIKKVFFGKGSKVFYLSYIGDVEVGKDVNLGCGFIIVNYDGKNKFLIKIEDGVFVGCNLNLIVFVIIGEGVYVVVGLIVMDDVLGKVLLIVCVK